MDRVLERPVGFGQNATGGAEGNVFHVTTLSDDGPGSLRNGAESPIPSWIVFDVSGDILLKESVRVQSNKTIDGRGARVVVRGSDLVLNGSSNVIIENLLFEGSVRDAIQISHGATDIWIDHCSLSNAGDGLIDITKAVSAHTTDVTVSWCRFFNHDKVMLIGAGPESVDDVNLRVTLHHNFFDRTRQRHPRLSFGKVHAFNNYLLDWSAGMASSQGGQLLIQANIFEAGGNVEGTVHTFTPLNGFISISKGEDLLINGARIHENEFERVFSAKALYAYDRDVADAALKEDLKAHTGWQA